jgi:hypothetical protein
MRLHQEQFLLPLGEGEGAAKSLRIHRRHLVPQLYLAVLAA